MFIDLALAKQHLNVDEAYTGDDLYIESLIEVAEQKVAQELCMSLEELVTLGGGKLPAPLRHAMLLSLGSYYMNREETTTIQTKPLEQGVTHLVALYRNYSK